MFGVLHRRRHGHCGPRGGYYHEGDSHEAMSAWFGVRRPLRFLVYRLELDEAQTQKLAAILDELKTERAQAAVDERRVQSALADALSKGEFDAAGAQNAARLRTESAERVARAVEKALASIHAILSQEQRERMATLVRSGLLGL